MIAVHFMGFISVFNKDKNVNYLKYRLLFKVNICKIVVKEFTGL